MRVDWRPFAVAAVVVLATALLGLPFVDALLVGGLALVLGLVWVTAAVGASYEWPEARLEETDGTRLDVASLTWAFLGRDGRVSENAVRRLRRVAAHRLADHGVRVTGALGRAGSAWRLEGQDAVRARELLGERAWRSLTAPGGIMPSVADVARTIEALERLGGAGASRSRLAEPRPATPSSAPSSTRPPAPGPVPAQPAPTDERPHP